MVTPAARREAVSFLRESYSVSERRACRSIGSERSSCRYRKRRREPSELIERIRVLAASKPRYGYRRLALLLRREGQLVKVKRVHRLYRQLGLSVQRRKRKRAAAQARRPSAFPTRANGRWSMDFVVDSRSDGRAIRLLTIVDDFMRESVVIEVGDSLTARLPRRVPRHSLAPAAGTPRRPPEGVQSPWGAAPDEVFCCSFERLCS